MAFAKISQVAHYVPEQVVTNHISPSHGHKRWVDFGQELNRTYFQNKSTSDLATEVAEGLLAKGSLTAEQIDFIIAWRQLPQTQ